MLRGDVQPHERLARTRHASDEYNGLFALRAAVGDDLLNALRCYVEIARAGIRPGNGLHRVLRVQRFGRLDDRRARSIGCSAPRVGVYRSRWRERNNRTDRCDARTPSIRQACRALRCRRQERREGLLQERAVSYGPSVECPFPHVAQYVEQAPRVRFACTIGEIRSWPVFASHHPYSGGRSCSSPKCDDFRNSARATRMLRRNNPVRNGAVTGRAEFDALNASGDRTLGSSFRRRGRATMEFSGRLRHPEAKGSGGQPGRWGERCRFEHHGKSADDRRPLALHDIPRHDVRGARK